MNRSERILIIIAAAGFAVGIVTHTVELISGGWLPYTSVPLWKNIYWTSLTFLDPLVIVLLFARPLPALVPANLVIISDVIINTGVFNYFGHYRIIMQCAFCVYVMAVSVYFLTKKRMRNV